MLKRIPLEEIQRPAYKNYDAASVKDSEQEGVSIERINEDILNNFTTDKVYGIDRGLVEEAEKDYNTGFYIKISSGKEIKKPLVFDYIADSQNDLLIDYNVIEVEPHSKVTIVFDYNSGEKGFKNGITRLVAKEGSAVNIVKIQRLGDGFSDFDNCLVEVGEKAAVNWSNVVIGAHISAFDVSVYLSEEGGNFTAKSVFLGVDSQVYDMSYKVYHYAPKTISSVDLKGALKGSAKATFIGNIDIKKGAKKAKAEENETVLLLDKTVRSIAIPALYCAEEDVQANHSASAGQIDENKLYYVMSRGFSLEEARLLMVQAVLNPVIDLIPYDPIREIILRGHIGRRIIK
jgi:FeS assembly protein SufD